ncbi:hypothetical protein F2Q68_00014905 [Brassica cretica]|uniref:Uncharacterized protein n=1 Tax=Brassica cretica TaxID=69181 RepID=A0A8S9HGL7_BRACR|nr:hypothetical protein F2Q68_00014905 [Brassica cretica]
MREKGKLANSTTREVSSRNNYSPQSTHGRPSTCFFEPPVVIIDFSWCCLFSGQLQHFWYGSAKEQCFMGTGISVGLSRITNVCHVLCNRGAQRKLPGDFVGLWIDFIALITSLRTLLVHDLVRQKLAANSPVTSTSMAEFIQTSSRQGRERSFSTSSFSKERFSPPTSLFLRGDPPAVFKTRKIYQMPSRLLSYVMAHLGSVDAMIHIQLRIEALSSVATSHVFVTNRSLFEDLEVRFESFLD